MRARCGFISHVCVACAFHNIVQRRRRARSRLRRRARSRTWTPAARTPRASQLSFSQWRMPWCNWARNEPMPSAVTRPALALLCRDMLFPALPSSALLCPLLPFPLVPSSAFFFAALFCPGLRCPPLLVAPLEGGYSQSTEGVLGVLKGHYQVYSHKEGLPTCLTHRSRPLP
jgi:hypothetical protein